MRKTLSGGRRSRASRCGSPRWPGSGYGMRATASALSLGDAGVERARLLDQVPAGIAPAHADADRLRLRAAQVEAEHEPALAPHDLQLARARLQRRVLDAPRQRDQ